MWFLRNLQDATTYYIRPEIAKHTVSRSTGELIIRDDPSISRNHAFLYPEATILKVVDAGSRYGTFINDAIESEREQIPKDTPTELKEDDRIRFGKCKSLWTVGRIEFNCITSTISANAQLKEALQKLGGKVHDAFEQGNTRFLIMKSITTTPKLLMCLIAQVPVVKPEYFEECVKVVEQGLALPEVDNYIPEFAEAYVRSEGMTFKKVPGRKTLFTGKVFVFIKPKHMSQYEAIVKLAGGSCFCAQKRKIAKSYFTQENVIVMQAVSDSMSQTSSQAVDGLTQIVTNSGRRLIPDAEIGLAILYCSLEKYCNPLYKFTNVLDLETIPFTQGETLAKNSEDLARPSKIIPKESISIPETESGDSSQHLDIHKSLHTDSMDYSEQPLKISEVALEFARPNENSADGVRGKRKRAEPNDSPKEIKKSRSKPTREESAKNPQTQFEVPETPSNQSFIPSSQAANMSGFLSVNHEAVVAEPSPQKQKQKRPLNLMLDDGDDDLFNFEGAAPKRTKRQQTLAESFSVSQSQHNRSSKSDLKGEDDLFSFENSTSKRSKNKTTSVEQSDTSTPVPKSTTTNGSTTTTSSTYKHFIKPIKIPEDGWLSATFCDLNIKSQDAEADVDSGLSSAIAVKKIKEEPDCTEEDVKTRVWVNEMEGMFKVRIKCMNLTSHRPGQAAGAESFFSKDGNETSAISGSGRINFKAFVKKQNYKLQQTIVKTRPVCVLDNTQDDHF